MFELLNLSPQEGYQFSSREVKELARRIETLEDLGEALLDFSCLQDLISWLNSL